MARGAGLLDDERLDALTQLLVVRLGVARHQDVRKARERRLPAGVATVERAIGDVDLLVAQTLDEHLAGVWGNLVPGHVGVVAQMDGNGVEHLRPIVAHVEDVAQGTVADGLVGRAYQVVDVDNAMDAQAVALGARAIGGVEREVARLQVVDGVAVLGARQSQRVLEQLARALSLFHEPHRDVALGQARSRLNGLGDATQRAVLYGDTVDNNFDSVLELLVERHAFLVVEANDLTVDAHTGKTLGAQVLEKLRVLTLAAAHDRCQHQRLATRCSLGDLVGDLVGRLALDNASTLRAVRCADAGIQKSQVVIDFCHRSHSGAGVFRRRLLVDGDSRGQTLDAVDVRLVHLPQEHARIARERLDVTALTFGEDGVKGQRALTRTGKACDDHELVAGNFKRDILEVVLARTSDDDVFLCHCMHL